VSTAQAATFKTVLTEFIRVNLVLTSEDNNGDELLIFTIKCNPVESFSDLIFRLEDVND